MGNLAHIDPENRQLAKDVQKVEGTGVRFRVGG